ncbi:MAG TPA: 3D domain-containing protein [Polyangiaceae bacterium]
MTGAEVVFVVTAYAVGCGAGVDTLTKTGRVPTVGHTIAVDPKVVPLHTPVWLDGLGTRVAEDTGRLIRGNRIDLFVSSCEEAVKWGRRTVRVQSVR